jgi:hypothetical protein
MVKQKNLFWVVLTLLSAVGGLYAQVNVYLHQPPPNQLKVPDLWYCDLENTTKNTYTVYLHAEVTEKTKGLIARANSNDFKLPPGTKKIKKGDIKEVKDTWYHKDYEEVITKTASFPEGEFEICISVIDAKTKRELSKDCIQQRVNPLGPPKLISPTDGAVVKEDHPLFTWVDIGDFDETEDWLVEIHIVEVLLGQTKEQAIKVNPPWFKEKDLLKHGAIKAGGGLYNFRYPIGAKALEKGKQYAWQVIGIIANKVLASEVWSFYTPTELIPPTSIPGPPIIAIPPPVPCDSFTECCLRLCRGWNLISLPMREFTIPFTTRLQDLIPDITRHNDVGRVGNILWWRPAPPGWTNSTNWLISGINFGSLNYAKGYLVYSNCEAEYCISGIPVNHWLMTLYPGWNLIGSVLCDTCPCCCGQSHVGIPWAEPCVSLTKFPSSPIPLTNLLGPFDNVCGSYTPTPSTTIEPFKGYWVYLNYNDSVRLSMKCCRDLVPLPISPCERETIPQQCQCQGWNPITITWPPAGAVTALCNGSITIPTIPFGSSISVTASPICIPPSSDCTPTCTWSVSALGLSGTGCSFTVGPITSTTPHHFWVLLNASCNSSPCPPCSFAVYIDTIIPPSHCECRWDSVRVTWPSGYSQVVCGVTSAVGPIPSGTLINVKFRSFCVPTPCQGGYTYTVTPPAGSPITGSCSAPPCIFSFTPTTTGSYDVLLQANCDGSRCPPCRFKIYIE